MLTGEENSIGDASSFTNAVSPRGKVMKDASPHSSSMKAMMRPCHCLLRQPLQTVRRSRCCFLASVMGSPASLGLRGANNTRDFNLKCGNGQNAGMLLTPNCQTCPLAVLRSIDERLSPCFPHGIF